MTRTRYRFGEDHYPHFMTATVVAWLPVFSQPTFANTVLDSWRFLQKEREIDVLAWVILVTTRCAVAMSMIQRTGGIRALDAMPGGQG